MPSKDAIQVAIETAAFKKCSEMYTMLKLKYEDACALLSDIAHLSTETVVSELDGTSLGTQCIFCGEHALGTDKIKHENCIIPHVERFLETK